MLEYEQIAYPIASIWAFSLIIFFWSLSRLGPKESAK